MARLSLVRWLIIAMVGGSLWSCGTPPRVSSGPPSLNPGQAVSSTAQQPLPPRDPAPGSLAYLDFKHGFRDLKFYDPPTPDMVLTEDGGNMKVYVRSQDELEIGQATARKIRYFFYTGRLYAVYITTKGYTNSRNLLGVLRQAYGAGERPNRFMDRYYWYGARVMVTRVLKPR